MKVVGLRLDLFKYPVMAQSESEVHVGPFYKFLEFCGFVVVLFLCHM